MTTTLLRLSGLTLVGLGMAAALTSTGSTTLIVVLWAGWLMVRTLVASSYGKASFSLAAAAGKVPDTTSRKSLELTSLYYDPEKVPGLKKVSDLNFETMKNVYEKLGGMYLGIPWLSLVIIWTGVTFASGALGIVAAVFVSGELVRMVKNELKHKAAKMLGGTNELPA